VTTPASGTAKPAPTPGSAPASASQRGVTGEHRPARVAALFVLPYLLLTVAWLASNPVAAAPDEDAHLVKALGIARLDIGVPYAGPVDQSDLGAVRNASISRVVSIPSQLSPAGYPCFQFLPEVTADCQPPPPAGTGDIGATTTLGAYPPFAYLPLGLAARAASSPEQAFTQGRVVVLVEAMLLLWLACWHLLRWLGRRALLGIALALTPVAVFCAAILNTSGLEIYGALGVAAVVAVATRRPESLTSRGTQAVTLGSGSALVLSRQLGMVTMAALVVLLLGVGGWPVLWQALRRGSWLLAGTIAVLAAEVVAMTGWELRFDHPVLLGPWVSWPSLVDFVRLLPQLVQEGIGRFGWLDTHMPSWSAYAWAGAVTAVTAAAIVVGHRRDRVLVLGMLLAALLLAYVTYSRVFHPIGAGLQGRHMLPFLAFVPVLAGIALSEQVSGRTLARMVTAAAVVLPALQLYGIYLNAKRYAVGLASGPTWFVPDARWSPPLGWYPWLALALVACVAMAVSWLRLARLPTQDRGGAGVGSPAAGLPS